jgi:hypothetical protein
MPDIESLSETVHEINEWAIDRIHTLCDGVKRDPLQCVEDAHSIQQEFAEWLDSNSEDDEVISIEYMPDWD